MTTSISASSHFEQGVAMLAQGRYRDAIDAFRSALSTQPDFAEAAFNCGVAFHQVKQWNMAVACYDRALQIQPGLVAARFNKADALHVSGRSDEAVDEYRLLLSQNPSHADAAYNLGCLLQSMGRDEEAETAYRLAIAHHPDHAMAHNNLGLLCREDNRFLEAISCFQKALDLAPDLVQARYNIGVARQQQGQFESGRLEYKAAVAQDPTFAPAYWLAHLSLPMIYASEPDIERHRREFDIRLDELMTNIRLDTEGQRRFALQGVASTCHFFLQYQGRNDRDLQQRYGRFVHRVMAANYPQWAVPRVVKKVAVGEKIRLGYVSSMMYAHTIGAYLMGWLASANREQFEIFCYHVGTRTDALTDNFRRCADHFHHFPSNIEAAAGQIVADDLHLLVHTDIGMNPVTMQLAAMRLAPVQCKGWGHPVTTGLPTIDYYLSSDLMEPDQAQDHYCEKLVRLPNLALYYDPPALPETPYSRNDLDLPEDRFLFLTTQSLFKYLPQDDDIYPVIAEAVPNAMFIFIEHNAAQVTRMFRNRLAKSFARHGLAVDHCCRFMPRLGHQDFLRLNLSCDVLLDSLQWSGGKTTLEALCCNLPVVTLPGGLMRGRHAYAMLRMMGIDDTIADSKTDYCRIAIRLAKDKTFYQSVRHRFRLCKHRLFRDRQFVRGLENFYRQAIGMSEAATDSETTSYRESGMPIDIHRLPSHEKLSAVGTLVQHIQTLEAQGQWQEAIDAYHELMRVEPDNAGASYNLGNLYLARQYWDKAIPLFEKALTIDGNMAVAANNLGKAWQGRGQRQKALGGFKKALRIDPGLAEAWFNLAEIQVSNGRIKAAIAAFRQALRAAPDMMAAWNNMGNAYRQMKDYTQAIDCYRRVVAHQPDLPQGHYNLGSTCRLDQNDDEAITHLTRALQICPEYAEAWNDLALLCKGNGDLKRALNYFNRALAIKPDLAPARWNRSFVYLLSGDMEKGWKDFEWRFRIPQWRSIYPFRRKGRRWEGQTVPGAAILVHDEQGLGDTLQFVRYLPMVRSRCGRLIFETRKALTDLVARMDGVDQVVARPEPGKKRKIVCDYHVPLMSLPGIFQTRIHSVPAQIPYLSACTDKVRLWADRLNDKETNIALVWAGRPEHTNDRNRSLNLDQFASLLNIDKARFYSLQKGPAAAQLHDHLQKRRLIDLGAHLDSFDDTAAVLAHMDLVICVDTSVAHLAGAMGLPVWVMIPYVPDWRWMMNSSTTPWYPSMRLFRQSSAGDWDGVLAEIKASLEQLIHQRAHPASEPDKGIHRHVDYR